MKLNGRRESSNFEDRRGMSGGQKVAGMGIGGLIIIGIIQLLMGGNPLDLLQQMGGLSSNQTEMQGEYKSTPEEKEQVKFCKQVLASTEDVWSQEFKKLGKTYQLRRCDIGSRTFLLLWRPETLHRSVFL